MARIFDIFSNIENETINKVLEKIMKETPGELVILVNNIADLVAKQWQTDAMNASPWGNKYASSIKINYAKDVNGFAKIYADENETYIDSKTGLKKKLGLFIGMVENGFGSFSIKDALLESKKAKTSSKGEKYIIVPFRYRTPSKGQKPSAGFAGVMTSDIYAAARAGKRLKGAKYGHMAGLKRYEKAGHGQYLTFRIVTEKSKGWQHPGARDTPVYKKVEDKVNKIIAIALDRYLRNLAQRGQNV